MTSWEGGSIKECYSYSDSGANCFIPAQAQGEGEDPGWSLRRKNNLRIRYNLCPVSTGDCAVVPILHKCSIPKCTHQCCRLTP